MSLYRMIFLVLIAVPIPAVVLYSFIMPTDVNIDIYWNSFFDSTSVTAILLFFTLLFSILWAVPTAFICRFFSFRGHNLWAYFLILPIAIPSYLNAFIFSDLFYYTGHIYLWFQNILGISLPFNIHSTLGAAFILSLSLFPYIFFPLYMRLGALPQNLFDVVSLQTNSMGKAFSLIALPFSLPIIAFSCALIGMEALADFGTTSFYGVKSLSVFVFNLWYQTSDSLFAVKMSFFFVLFIGSLLAIEYWSRPLKNIMGSYDIDLSYGKKIELSLFGAMICTAICFIPVFLGFLLPVGYFLTNTLFYHYDNIIPSFGFLWQTAYPAFFAALICVAVSLLFSFWQKTERMNIAEKSLILFATSGYAFPGIILGLVVLISTTFFDHMLNDLLGFFGISPIGTIISGGMFGLIFAYFLRFLTVSYGNIKTISDQITYSLFEASSLMGYNKFQIIRSVFLPLLQKPVFVAFILVFIDIVKELPITLLLRPFGFESLTTYTYNMAGLEQIAESSPSALMIIMFGIVACMVPFIAISTKKDPV